MNSKTLLYIGIAVVLYVVYTKYQTQQKAIVAAAAGNSTAGIIGASVGGISAILSELPYGDDDDDV